MKELYPVFFNLEGKPCLVVGGGRVALRKVKGLLDAGAQVSVIAPKAGPELKALAGEGGIRLREETFQGDVGGFQLVFSATDDRSVNQAVFEACEKAFIPVNVADQPEQCRFQVPARYKEGRLQIAVSTSGNSPAFCRRLREELGSLLDPWAPRILEWLADLRVRLKKLKPDDPLWRGVFLNRLVDTRFNEIMMMAKDNDRFSFETLIEGELKKEEGEKG